MDWVHCNNCYVQPGDVENKKFFITNCGHIYCNECQQVNKSNDCRICHVQYSVIPLTSDMNSDVEIYFHDPLVNLKKQMKVLEFQQSHRVRLVSYNRERIRSYKAVKKENFNLNEELKMYKKENAVLREELKRVKKDFHEYKKKCHETMSAKSLRTHSFKQFMTKDTSETSPNLFSKRSGQSDGNFSLNLKRPSNSNLFLMTESKPTRKDETNFTTPDIPRFPATYRSYKTSTPDMSTPPTPETFFKECSQRDVQRRVKLPSGPSPATRIGFHGLSLSRPISTPKKEGTVHSKYPKYFK